MVPLVAHANMTIDADCPSLPPYLWSVLLKGPRKKSPKAKVKQRLLSAKRCKAYVQFGQLEVLVQVIQSVGNLEKVRCRRSGTSTTYRIE